MTFKNDMHFVMIMMRTGHVEAVTEAINGLYVGQIMTFSASMDSGHKGLFGVNVKEDGVMMVCICHTNNLDTILSKAIEAGDLNNPEYGMCFSVPLDRMYMADTDMESPGEPDNTPAELEHQGD